MKIQVTKSDVIWNYIGIIVSLGSNFILIPFLIAFLDTDMYGLWNVFISLGAISNLFDFGFNSIFSRNVAYCWSGVNELKKEDVVISEKNSKTNYKLMKQVIKTCQIIYSIISSVAFMMLALFGSIYILSISSYLNNNIIILVAWILYALGIFFNLLYGYFDSFLRGIGKIGAVNKIRTFTKIVQMVMTVILLYCGLGIISASIAYIISGLIFRFTCKRIFYQYSNIGEKMQNEPNPTKKEIYNTFTIVWHNAWKEGVVSLSNYISNQATTLLCASFLTLTEVGKYSLAVQLTSAVGQISTALFASYQPSFQEAYTHRNFDYIRKYLSFSMTIYILLFFLGITGIVIVVIPILQYVRPNAIVDIVVLFEIAFYQFILKYRDCYSWYLAGTNRLYYTKSFVFSSIFCLCLSLILLKFYNLGIFGLVIAQLISQLIFNAWYWPIVVDRELKLDFLSKIKCFVMVCREYLNVIFISKGNE